MFLKEKSACPYSLKNKKWEHYLWKSVQEKNHGIESLNPFFPEPFLLQDPGVSVQRWHSLRLSVSGGGQALGTCCLLCWQGWSLVNVCIFYYFNFFFFSLHIHVCNISLIKEEFTISFPVNCHFSLTFPKITTRSFTQLPLQQKGEKGEKNDWNVLSSLSGIWNFLHCSLGVWDRQNSCVVH